MLTPLARFGVPPLRLDWPRLLPFLRWRNRVNKQSLRDDLVAGLTGALVALPQGVAFATIAGMPPEYGLYAGMIPAIIASAVRFLLASGVGADHGGLDRAVFGAVAPCRAGHGAVREPGTDTDVSGGDDPAGDGAGAHGHAGQLHLAFGGDRVHRRRGDSDRHNQVKHFFGLEIARGTSFSETWSTLFTQFGQVQPGVVAVSILTLGLGIAVKRFFPSGPT